MTLFICNLNAIDKLKCIFILHLSVEISVIIFAYTDIDRERVLKRRLADDEDKEEFDSEESEDDEEKWPSSTSLQEEEKMSLRKEFVEAAYHSFLAGFHIVVHMLKQPTIVS